MTPIRLFFFPHFQIEKDKQWLSQLIHGHNQAGKARVRIQAAGLTVHLGEVEG